MASTIDEFDNEFDDYDEFDDDERGISGFVVLLIILAMLLAFSFIVWMAYNKGIRQGEAARTVPYVAADPEPVKTAANETTSGSSQNREVYDRFDGKTANTPEVLTDGPEEPIVADQVDTIAALAASAEETAGKVASTDGVGAADAVRYEASQSDQLTSVISAAVRSTEETAAKTVQTTSASSTGVTGVTPASASTTTPSIKPAASANTQPVATTATNAAASRSSVPVASSVGGTHVVQVAAFRSEAEADVVWGRLQSRFGSYMDGKAKDVERADLGAKGIYYRLRIAGFNSADEAKTYCSGLKARNQDCLVKKL